MIKNNLGYSIEQHRNGICIHFPPTSETATNTIEPVRNRKKTLRPNDLAGILFLVTYLVEKRGEEERRR